MSSKYFIYPLFILTLWSSCLPSNRFEDSMAIPNHVWKSKFNPSFRFKINDTLSHYRMDILMRHTDAYSFSNIWLLIQTKFPDGTIKEQKVEFPLAEKSGKWIARGIGEVFEHKLLMSPSGLTKFPQKGNYVLTLIPIMRQDPLKEIMSVGLSIKKITKSRL